jgi:hypothetical protein
MRNIPASATTPWPVDLQNSDSAACTCYRNFPIMADRKAEAEACRILSGISVAEISRCKRLCARPNALSAGKFP